MFLHPRGIDKENCGRRRINSDNAGACALKISRARIQSDSGRPALNDLSNNCRIQKCVKQVSPKISCGCSCTPIQIEGSLPTDKSKNGPSPIIQKSSTKKSTGQKTNSQAHSNKTYIVSQISKPSLQVKKVNSKSPIQQHKSAVKFKVAAQSSTKQKTSKQATKSKNVTLKPSINVINSSNIKSKLSPQPKPCTSKLTPPIKTTKTSTQSKKCSQINKHTPSNKTITPKLSTQSTTQINKCALQMKTSIKDTLKTPKNIIKREISPLAPKAVRKPLFNNEIEIINKNIFVKTSVTTQMNKRTPELKVISPKPNISTGKSTSQKVIPKISHQCKICSSIIKPVLQPKASIQESKCVENIIKQSISPLTQKSERKFDTNLRDIDISSKCNKEYKENIFQLDLNLSNNCESKDKNIPDEFKQTLLAKSNSNIGTSVVKQFSEELTETEQYVSFDQESINPKIQLLKSTQQKEVADETPGETSFKSEFRTIQQSTFFLVLKQTPERHISEKYMPISDHQEEFTAKIISNMSQKPENCIVLVKPKVLPRAIISTKPKKEKMKSTLFINLEIDDTLKRCHNFNKIINSMSPYIELHLKKCELSQSDACLILEHAINRLIKSSIIKEKVNKINELNMLDFSIKVKPDDLELSTENYYKNQDFRLKEENSNTNVESIYDNTMSMSTIDEDNITFTAAQFLRKLSFPNVNVNNTERSLLHQLKTKVTMPSDVSKNAISAYSGLEQSSGIGKIISSEARAPVVAEKTSTTLSPDRVIVGEGTTDLQFTHPEIIFSPIQPNSCKDSYSYLRNYIKPQKKMTLVKKSKTSRYDESPSYSLNDFIPEYINDIITLSMVVEYKVVLKRDFYLKHNPCLENRAKTLNWLITIQDDLHMTNEMYLNNVNLFDVVLSKISIPSNMYQLVMVTIAWLTNKYSATKILSAPKLVKLCSNSYSQKQLLDMEWKLLSIIQYNFSTPNPILFVNYYLYKLNVQSDHELVFATYYVLESFTLSSLYSTYTPSKIAAAALYLCTTSLYPGEDIYQRIEYVRGYYPSCKLLDLVKMMLQHMKLITSNHCIKVIFSKYNTKETKFVSKKFSEFMS